MVWPFTLVGEFLKSSADESSKLSDSIENALQKHDKLLVSTLTGHIEKYIELMFSSN